MQGQGTFQYALILGALVAGADEGHLGELLHVEEIGAAQVFVARLVVESTLAASISKLALAAAGLASSMLKVPLKVLKRPTSSEKPR